MKNSFAQYYSNLKYVAGWGKTNSSPKAGSSDKLNNVILNTMNSSYCEKYTMVETNWDSQICCGIYSFMSNFIYKWLEIIVNFFYKFQRLFARWKRFVPR